MCKTHRAYLGSGTLAILCAFAAGVRAQQDNVPPGVVATLSVTQGLEISDNPEFEAGGESDVFGRTSLAFGLESATRTQNFAFSFGGDIDKGREGRSYIDVTSPFLELAYDREVRNSALALNFGYRELDTDSTFFLVDLDPDPDAVTPALLQDNATLQRYDFGLTAEFGREAPIGARFQLNLTELDYADTVNPNLTDRRNERAVAELIFRIDPTITARLTGRYSLFDTNGNGVNRETTALGFGVQAEVSPRLSADVEVNYTKTERSGNATGVNEGIGTTVSLVRDMPTGDIGLSFDTNVNATDNGRRSSLRFNRSLELPRGALSFSLGLTGPDWELTDPLVSVDYQHALPRGTFNFGLSQVVNTDLDNQEEINTSLRAGYTQQINNLSSLSLDFFLFHRNDLEPAGGDAQRLNLSLSYRYELTRDWGLVGRVSHARFSSDIEPERSSNTLFLGLEREFVWFP